MTCKDCIYASQPTTTMRCRNHGINMSDNAVVCNEFKDKPKTKADRVRAMTDEKLAAQIVEWIEGVDPETGTLYDNDIGRWLDWLKQEADAK